ncbi:MAG: peptide-methionine (R)-S-oxide reductase MsrB [Myxococcota bacterium]|nr:peptide-methionine (R)-S-oxide reductase MsrB [Myxococcota bacterium]
MFRRLLPLLLVLGSSLSPACSSQSVAEPSTFQPGRSDAITKTDEQWRTDLTPEEYRILRKAGTERPFTGKNWNNTEAGTYRCAACGLDLFHSEHKFKSGTGWPSFTQPIAENHVGELTDRTLGMKRTEVLCDRCGGHLGHVFEDGPRPTGLRYCINGNAMDFVPTSPASAKPATEAGKPTNPAEEK